MKKTLLALLCIIGFAFAGCTTSQDTTTTTTPEITIEQPAQPDTTITDPSTAVTDPAVDGNTTTN